MYLMMFALTVSRFFTRDKWTQTPPDEAPLIMDENVSYSVWYDLNGEKKAYNVYVRDSELRFFLSSCDRTPNKSDTVS